MMAILTNLINLAGYVPDYRLVGLPRASILYLINYYIREYILVEVNNYPIIAVMRSREFARANYYVEKRSKIAFI